MNRLTKAASLSSIVFALSSPVLADTANFDSSVTGDGETTYTFSTGSDNPLRRETDIALSADVELEASAGDNNIAVTTRHTSGATQYAGDTEGGSLVSSENDSFTSSAISSGTVSSDFGGGGDGGSNEDSSSNDGNE